jgi:hypothetical protein
MKDKSVAMPSEVSRGPATASLIKHRIDAEAKARRCIAFPRAAHPKSDILITLQRREAMRKKPKRWMAISCIRRHAPP